MIVVLLCVLQQQATPSIEISAGGFWKAMPATVTYEATVPLLYETVWTEEEVKGTELKGDCSKDDCVVIAGLENLRISFEREFKSLTQTWSPSYLQNCSALNENRKRRALNFLGDAFSWCCGVATQHKLDALTMDEHDLRTQVIRLQKGMSKTLQTITKNSEKFVEYDKAITNVFKETEERIHLLENFIVKAMNKENNDKKEEKFYIMSIWNHQVQNLKHIIQLTRAMKRHSILNSCRQHQIPIATLEPAILRHDLERLQGELEEAGQSLTIRTQELSRYYQLPICDCGFSKDKLIITIRIPITRAHRTWNLFELITTPFAWENQTCRINLEPLLLAVAEDLLSKEPHVRQISGLGLRHCQPFKSKLCYLPRYSADSMQGPACARKLFHGASIEEISHNCPMSCHKSSMTSISEIGEDTFIITHPKFETKIVCPNSTQPFPESSYMTPGAVKLYLYCQCKLVTEGETIIPQRFPCGESTPLESKSTHVIPAAWSTLKSFVLTPDNQENLPKFLKPEECLNRNWTLHIPHINLTSTEEVIRAIMGRVEPSLDNTYADLYGHHSDTIFLIWNITLSALVAYLLFRRQPVGAVPAVFAPVRGEPTTQSDHEIYFYIILTGLLIFTTYLCIKACIIFTQKRKKIRETPRPDKPQRATPQQTPSQGQIVLHMGSNLNVEALQEGKTLEFVLQEMEETPKELLVEVSQGHSDTSSINN